MADNLEHISVGSPGFFGLNTQESGIDLPVGYALEAQNCVIDSFGRIGARKGWTELNTSTGTLGSNDITAVFEYTTVTNDKEILLTGNKKIFKLSGNSLVEIYSDTTLTGNNWKIVQLKNKAVFFQEGNDPLEYNGTTVVKINASTGYVGTVPKSGIVTAAFGRLWSAIGATVYWSDLLSTNNWGTGTSGSLDLTTVFPNGADEVTGIAAHNGFLVILCRKCIIVYNNGNTPSSLSLSDIMPNVGCIAKNSIQATGNDLIFLSDRGVMSLGTLVSEKALPQNDLSKNIRDQLLNNITGTNLDSIKSVYYEKDAFYLLTIPTYQQVYCFDMRARLENGASRVTVWQNIVPNCFAVTKDRSLLMGFNGKLGKYNGYSDNGVGYRMVYYTNNMKLGTDQDTTLKLLKRGKFTVFGGSPTGFVIKWGFDYSGNYQSVTVKTPITVNSEYNVAQYNIDSYYTGSNVVAVSQQLGGSGIVTQLGFEADINGYPLSIQKMDIFYKTGKKL